MKNNFVIGIEELRSKGVDNLCEAWRDSGACIFLADDVDINLDFVSLLNQWGVIGFDWTKDNIKDIGLINQTIRNLDELDAVAFMQRTMALGLNSVEGITGPAWVGYSEVVKHWTHGTMMTCLNDELLNRLGEGLIGGSKEKANEYSKYGVSVDSDLTKRLKELALTGELMGIKFLVEDK